jgi:hypothetical protein
MGCPKMWAAEQDIVMAISTVSTGITHIQLEPAKLLPATPTSSVWIDRRRVFRENREPMPGARVAPGSERSGYRHMPPICAPILPMPSPGWWP